MCKGRGGQARCALLFSSLPLLSHQQRTRIFRFMCVSRFMIGSVRAQSLFHSQRTPALRVLSVNWNKTHTSHLLSSLLPRSLSCANLARFRRGALRAFAAVDPWGWFLPTGAPGQSPGLPAASAATASSESPGLGGVSEQQGRQEGEGSRPPGGGGGGSGEEAEEQGQEEGGGEEEAAAGFAATPAAPANDAEL